MPTAHREKITKRLNFRDGFTHHQHLGVKIMSASFDLSLEQQFNIRAFEQQVQDMTHEQAQEFLVSLYRQTLLRENSYKSLLKQQWGIENFGQQAA